MPSLVQQCAYKCNSITTIVTDAFSKLFKQSHAHRSEVKSYMAPITASTLISTRQRTSPTTSGVLITRQTTTWPVMSDVTTISAGCPPQAPPLFLLPNTMVTLPLGQNRLCSKSKERGSIRWPLSEKEQPHLTTTVATNHQRCVVSKEFLTPSTIWTLFIQHFYFTAT